jgi:LysM repeat protein
MTVLARFFRAALTAFVLVSLNGCMPASQGDLDEEKEPHFIAGKNAINSMDYRGAIEEFEKALEVNPRNSKAHAQLGWLYEEKEADAAAAIYHYERYLRLRPESDNAEVIRQRINNCKQDLAKTVLPLPITPGMQRQFDQLVDENKRLKEENEKWKAYFASRPLAPTNLTHDTTTTPTRVATGSNVVYSNPPPRRIVSAPRTHVVQAGDTPASICRRYNVRLSAFLSANPALDPRRMRVGQVVNIPAGSPD